MKAKLLSAVTTLALATMAQATITPIMPNEKLNWQPARTLPPGAEIAVLSGDPTKKEPFVARVKLPAQYTIPPHEHSVPEYDIVLSGTLYIGMGDKLDIDSDKNQELPAGSYVKIPAHQVHYSWTKQETILQISGVGPWGTIYFDKGLNKKYS